MKFKYDVYNSLCSVGNFTVNGIEADEEDFGEGYDCDPGSAEPYCCGNRVFKRFEPSREVLEKYGINEEEYSEICDSLTDDLSWGACGWCS